MPKHVDLGQWVNQLGRHIADLESGSARDKEKEDRRADVIKLLKEVETKVKHLAVCPRNMSVFVIHGDDPDDKR